MWKRSGARDPRSLELLGDRVEPEERVEAESVPKAVS